MTALLLFVLPDGRSAEVATPSARLICDRLWDLGIEPGAATAATRINDALKTHPAFAPDVRFTPRELAPLGEATRGLIVIDPDEDQGEVRALISDIERLRDTLRSTN